MFDPRTSFLTPSGIYSVFLARDLNALNLGEEVANGLGRRVPVQRGLLLLPAVALAGSTVAAAGTIGFVGLVAPHLAWRLVGPNGCGKSMLLRGLARLLKPRRGSTPMN